MLFISHQSDPGEVLGDLFLACLVAVPGNCKACIVPLSQAASFFTGSAYVIDYQ